MMKRPPHCFKLALAAVCLISLVACDSASTKSPREIDIGYLGTFTGRSKTMGTHAAQGAALGIEDWNNSHPATQLRLHSSDDQGLPPLAQKNFVEFWNTGIRFFIGPFLTASATALIYESLKYHALIIGPVIAGANLSGHDDFFIRLFPTTHQIGSRLGRFLRDRKVSRIAVVSDFRNRDYALEIFDSTMNELEKKGEQELLDHWIIDPDYVKSGSLARKVREWKNKGAGAVLMILSPPDTLQVCSELKRQGFLGLRMAAPWAIDTMLQTRPGAEGLLFYAPLNFESKSPRYASFVDAYRRKYGENPSYPAAFNYEAVFVLGRALENSRDLQPEQIKKTIVSVPEYSGLQSPFSLDRYGDTTRALSLHQIRNHRFALISSGATE